ncbi:Rhodanese-like protein [Atractiella rhizophila]|nr:Rhodanese-like protein [Atractiella rhizophila]
MSFNKPKYQFETADEIASILKDPEKRNGVDYAIVDVRDDDYIGGNIPGCKHVPSIEIKERIADLTQSLTDVPLVIFHCALSQQRGPNAALFYANQLPPESEQRVVVLRHGFTGWQAKFKDDPKLVENYDARFWT